MSYELYNQMIEAYTKKDNTFAAMGRNWIESTDTNPFTDKEAHELFFKAKKYCRIWRNGGIDSRSAKKNMINMLEKLASMNIEYPAELIEKEKELENEQLIKEETILKEQTAEELNDIDYVISLMRKSYDENNDVNFKQFVVHLVNIAENNPFNEDTEEHNLFEEMKESCKQHNIRRVIVVAKQLCEALKSLDSSKQKKVVLKEPEKILGVPDEETDKKSWFKFLHPWR